VLTFLRFQDAPDFFPMLNDKRPAEGQTLEHGIDKDAPHPYRVCDLTASILAHKFPKTSFNWKGSYADLDRQIKKIQEEIANREF